MNTEILDLKKFADLNIYEIKKLIAEAAEEIKNGNVIAFPTETVYGLGANALSKEAVKKIFEIKGRPSDNPLIVHISSINQIERLVDIKKNQNEKILLDRLTKAYKYWPGPISFIFPANLQVIPQITLGNLVTVALRYPDHKIAQSLIELSGCPIAAPSANISGKPSCTIAEDVYLDFKDRISFIIDGGSSVYGIESTVVDLTSIRPAILRPGFITMEDLIIEFKDIEIQKKNDFTQNPRSPGMKYTHYKPDAKVILIFNRDEFEVSDNHELLELKKLFSGKIIKAQDLPDDFFKQKRFIYLSGGDEFKNIQFKNKIKSIFNINLIYEYIYSNPYDFAKNIYSIFREADKKKIDFVMINQSIKNHGIELAIINRIVKAAEEIWVF